MTSRYHLYCDVLHLQDEEEEDEDYEIDAIVTIQIRRWKIERSDVELTAVGSSEHEFELQDDVVERNGELFREVTARLTELGIAEAGHGTMIDELLDYIHVVVIQGQGLYDRPARVCMDVVEAIEIEESHVEEAVSRSIITHSESELSWLTIFDMDLEEEEESESAEDDLEEAARLSMDMLDAVNTTPPLSKFDVAAMLEGLQQVEAGEAEDGEAFLCVICMEGKCDDESGGFKQMPCNHVLHATCAHTWFRISPSCPLCRFRLKNKS